MTRGGMDPEGIGVYTVLKNLCIIERNKSEGSRTYDKVSSPKIKPRSPRSLDELIIEDEEPLTDLETDLVELALFPEMKKDLEKYIGKLGTTLVDSSIKYPANYMYQVFSLSPGDVNVLGWVQEDFKNKPAPSINSETGKLMEVLQESIIPEVSEQSCYLMQTIRIGGSEVLVF